MNRTKISLISALVAGLSFSGTALAADKSSDAVQNPKAAAERGPTNKNYDSVRQEHVEREVADQGAAGRTGDKQRAPKVRDWDAIDKNNDNLIQPDEMEAYLNKYGPSEPNVATK